MDYAERMMRQRISEIPDGEYMAEGWLDDDGRNREQRLKVKVTVRVRGDELDVDLTGSADQTPTAYNVPFEGSTKVAAYAAFRKLLPGNVWAATLSPADEGVAVDGKLVRDLPPSVADKLRPQSRTQRVQPYKPIARTVAPASREHGVLVRLAIPARGTGAATARGTVRLRWTGALARAELVDALERELAVLPVSGSTVTVPFGATVIAAE